MTEPTYTIILTETERTLWAKVMGGLVTKLINAPIFIESPAGGTQAARAVLAPHLPQTQNPPLPVSTQAAPPAAAPSSTPIEPRDRWARDRKGNEVPNPADAYPADVYIWKTEQKETLLRVSWQSSSGQGNGDANCFDSNLWPWLIARKGQKTRLYLVAKGKYTNIVGVRA